MQCSGCTRSFGYVDDVPKVSDLPSPPQHSHKHRNKLTCLVCSYGQHAAFVEVHHGDIVPLLQRACKSAPTDDPVRARLACCGVVPGHLHRRVISTLPYTTPRVPTVVGDNGSGWQPAHSCCWHSSARRTCALSRRTAAGRGSKPRRAGRAWSTCDSLPWRCSASSCGCPRTPVPSLWQPLLFTFCPASTRAWVPYHRRSRDATFTAH